MNLDPVAERIMNEKAFPWRGPSVVSRNIRCGQFSAQTIHISAFEPKVPLRIRTLAVVLNRKMHVESACIEPNAAAAAERFRFGNFLETKKHAVKCPSNILASLRHGEVDMRKAHDLAHVTFLSIFLPSRIAKFPKP
jgi:hypothetical protein